MDGKVRMGRGCKRGCNHGNKNRYYNKARDDPQNAEHSTESGLGRTVTIPVEKDCFHHIMSSKAGSEILNVTYPTVVMVTNAHQNPSQTPFMND